MGYTLNTTTLNGTPGSNFVLSTSLRYRQIVQVSRSGLIYDLIQSPSLFFPVTPPANTRQVSYYKFLGEFIFPTDAVFNTGETVTIKWKT